MIKVVYIATDLIKTDEGYCFNAVYAFKTMTSVSGYDKYLRSSGKDHLLSVTSAAVEMFNTLRRMFSNITMMPVTMLLT